MFRVDQSVVRPPAGKVLCTCCCERERRPGGRLCRGCHALDMRDRRRKARRELLAASLHKRRGRLDDKL
jgi:hypothetical protein